VKPKLYAYDRYAKACLRALRLKPFLISNNLKMTPIKFNFGI